MLVEADFYLAEGLGWSSGLFTFILTSALLFSLAGVKMIVTSWLLNGLFGEGCSAFSRNLSQPPKPEVLLF